MTAVQVEQALLDVATCAQALPEEARDLRQHIAAQGAQVATLQANVAELEQHAKELDSTCVMLHGERDAARAEVDGLRKEVSGLMGERDTWRAEVERLKADRLSERQDWELAATRLHTRAETAESRLAAIRERAGDLDELIERFLWMSGDKEVSGNALQFVARWVLEGDAPNSPEMPDGSGEAPKETRCSGRAPDCGPGCMEHGVGRSSQETKHAAPAELVLACEACRLHRPHVWVLRGSDSSPRWRCDTCGWPSNCGRYPCSPTRTHADAATPGHPERVKERSEAFTKEAVLAAIRNALAAMKATDSETPLPEPFKDGWRAAAMHIREVLEANTPSSK